MPDTRPKRLWLAKLTLLTLSIGVAVVGMDILIRLTGRDSPLVWRPDPVLGWWHIPNSELHWTSEGDGWVHINSLGIRDPERGLAKHPGTLRIAVFGDSMTQGVQVNVDQTFTQLLERRLSTTLSRPVEVWNFGVNGYSPLQEYLLFKAQAPAVKPDLVIHAVFLDNDVADLHPALASGQRGAPFATVADDGQLHVDYTAADRSHRDYNQQPIALIRRMSALYRVISSLRWQRIDAASASGSAATGIPRRFLLYAEPPAPEWDAAWQTLDAVIGAFAADGDRAGIEYILLSVPAGQVVNHEAWSEFQRAYPAMSSTTWNLAGPEERLREIATRRGLSLVAPASHFANDPKRRDLFFGRVGHFTPVGHQVMAAVLETELIRRHGLNPRP